MASPTIRIIYRDVSGFHDDDGLDMSVDDFGGLVPAVGDTILKPGVRIDLDRHDASNREVWTVVQRIFNPMDLADYIALVVEYRPGKLDDPFI